jgi:hypothetical protein
MSSAPDDRRKRPKHAELRNINNITLVASSWYHSLIVMIKMHGHTTLKYVDYVYVVADRVQWQIHVKTKVIH